MEQALLLKTFVILEGQLRNSLWNIFEDSGFIIISILSKSRVPNKSVAPM